MNTPATVSRWLAIPIAALSCMAPVLGAQEEAAVEAGPGKIYVDAIDVNVVNVEVYVTDKQGKRVHGLTRDDFELLEDDRPVKITNFYAVKDGRPEAVPGAQPAPEKVDREPLLDVRQAEQKLPEDQRLSLILYFDNLFLKPFSRNRVVSEVRRFLHTNVKPGDRVMLVTFERSLHVRHPFTSDMRAISDALFEIETLSAFAVQGDSDRRDVLQRFEQAKTALEAESHVDLYAQSLHFDVQTTIRNLKQMVSSLAGLPGRKAILHVSDGIPMTAGEDLFFMLTDRFGDDAALVALRSNRYDNRRLFRELTATANANRVTFYTLEARGLRSHTSLSAEYAGSVGRDGTVAGSRIEADIVRLSGNQEPLMMMALDTGGLATIGSHNFDGAFQRTATDFRSYYSLGYASAHSGGGRYHDIEVKMKRKGLKLRHRTGYRDKTIETQLSEGTLAALMYGYDTNPMEIELQFDRARPDAEDKNRYLLPIEVRVPLGKATLLPQTEVHHGRLRFSVAVIDEDGRMSPVEQTPVPLSIPNEQIEIARTQYYVYTAELRMRRGRQRVAIGVRDEFANESSYIRRPILIGKG